MQRSLAKTPLFHASSNTLYKAYQDARRDHLSTNYSNLLHDQCTLTNLLLTRFFPPSAGFTIWPAGNHHSPLRIRITSGKQRTIPTSHTFVFEIHRLRPRKPAVDAEIEDLFIHHATVLVLAAHPALRSRWCPENEAFDALRELSKQKGIVRGPVLMFHADTLEVHTYDARADALRPFVVPGVTSDISGAAYTRIAPRNLDTVEKILEAVVDAEVRYKDGEVWKVREGNGGRVVREKKPVDPLRTWKVDGKKKRKRDDREEERRVERPSWSPIEEQFELGAGIRKRARMQ